MSRQRILVVDDEETLCEALRFNLEAEGFEVETAFSAEQALAMPLESFDLFLLDIMMGEISGVQLARIIKANPATAAISIIFCTARDSEDDIEESYRYIVECDMLIIDDLGTELNNSFVSSQLFYCINERIGRKKGTIISTNLSMSMLKDTYSDRVTSRIMSNYRVIPLYGADIRMKKRVFA